MNEICEYAASAGLDIIVYFGSDYNSRIIGQFLNGTASYRDKLVGVYFGDEPGGKMLDTRVDLHDPATGETATKVSAHPAMLRKSNGGSVQYTDYQGMITVTQSGYSILYYPDGRAVITTGHSIKDRTTYLVDKDGIVYTVDKSGNITSRATEALCVHCLPKLESYDALLAERPFQTYDETARRLVDECKEYNDWLHRNYALKSITSDYALYWWDNLGGYDTVLAELGWNNTVAQEIALARGAANLQGKEWGTIITWKYTTAPYLASGNEIYQQMRTSYEAGAKYILIFNYAKDMEGPYGTLQDEHFAALERFWNDVVQNPNVTRGSVKAEAALVLPENYGWGLRRQNDTIWGIWQPDDKSPQVWTALQESLAKHDVGLDIVYDDPAYPVAGKYPQVYYWNQTG
jgi:hypothetical protein